MRRLLPLLLLAPTALVAQVPRTSARALGLAGANTVGARGFEATAWNPAVLAASDGRPGFSLALPELAIEFGSNAYGFGDFTTYEHKTLTAADKATLLGKVDSTLDVRTIAGITPFGFQIGRLAITSGVAGDLRAGLGKDAVELALYGNASRSGPGEFFTAAGSHADGWGAATIAASYATPFRLPLGRLSVGVTGKYIAGVGLARGAETASHLQVNPAFGAQAAGHAIYTHYSDNEQSPAGSGYGVDLGGVLELPGGLTLGATLVNVVGSMSWNADRLQYERVDYMVTQAGSGQVNDTQVHTSLRGAQIDSDPVARAFRDSLLDHAGFSRLARVGAQLHLGGLRVAGDAQLRLAEGLDDQPSQLVSAGAEYILLGILPLRGGVATDFSSGLTLSAGSGLYLGPVKIDLGIANISGTDHPGVRVAGGLSLVFGGGRRTGAQPGPPNFQ